MSATSSIPPRVKAVTLQENGDLVRKIGDGPATVVAHFDAQKKFLEFENEEGRRNEQLYNQVIAAIATTEKGTTQSGNAIRTIGVKGMKLDEVPATAPKRPKVGPLGDLTHEVVDWYFRYKPKEAFIRYGVITDANGNPRRATVRRQVVEIVQDFDGTMGLEGENENRGQKIGKNKWLGGYVREERKVITLENVMIANRPTHLTGLPNEVVGGFVADEDGETRDDE